MKLTTKPLTKLSILAIVLVGLFASGCKKDPLPPMISEIKVCNEALVEDALCESSLSTFGVDEAKIYVSGKFSNIDQNTLILFTLFGQDTNGNWINLSDLSTRPSDEGEFDDDAEDFRLNIFFKKDDSVQWPKTSYRVDVEIDREDGVKDSIEFEVI